MVPVDDEVADGVKALSYPPHYLKLLERLQCLLLRRQICAPLVCRTRACGREVQQDVEASCGLSMALYTFYLQLMQFCENKYMSKSMTSQFQRTIMTFFLCPHKSSGSPYMVYVFKYGYLGFYTHFLT